MNSPRRSFFCIPKLAFLGYYQVTNVSESLGKFRPPLDHQNSSISMAIFQSSSTGLRIILFDQLSLNSYSLALTNRSMRDFVVVKIDNDYGMAEYEKVVILFRLGLNRIFHIYVIQNDLIEPQKLLSMFRSGTFKEQIASFLTVPYRKGKIKHR